MAASKVPCDEHPLHRLRRAEGEAEEAALRPSLQFSLGTMLLVMTLVASCLAMSLAVPLLGIPLSVIAAAGLVRTAIVGSARIRAGERFEWAEKLREFAVSSAVSTFALVAGFVTFAAIANLAMITAMMLAEFDRSLRTIVLFPAVLAILAGSGAGIFVFVRLYLPFDPSVWELRQKCAQDPAIRENDVAGDERAGVGGSL
jgi:hypothetical protein